jgi:diaminopimelate decarboxylase
MKRVNGGPKPPRFHFGHSRAAVHFWRGLAARALKSQATPFYLFSVEPLRQALRELKSLEGDLPIRHWLSCKTQPVRPLLQWWRRQGRGIEVVSEFELLAALEEGFSPGRILVNGPAKQAWLKRHPVRGLWVNFDSLNETRALAGLASRLAWRVGVRLHTAQEFDPENPAYSTQFGMQREEAFAALKFLQQAGSPPEVVHFHLRTNVASPAIYQQALAEVADVCRGAGFSPAYVDCGGGLPPPHVLTPRGRPFDAQFDLPELARVYRLALKAFPDARELWLENGRFLSARSGVLVVRVLDIKERGGLRQLICDGGRTLHALVSNWEVHGMFVWPERRGPARLTAVCGPTCMAFDQLARRDLPGAIRPGDCLVWMDAGAYHVSWETRFSHGLAGVLWHDGRRVSVSRKAESFQSWWGQWKT